MNIISVSKSVIFTLLSFCVTSASAQGSETSKLKIPNTFETNKVIIASDMNDNFDEIENKVNDLDGRLGSLNDSLGARSQFVGFSDNMVTGKEGIFEMQKACNNFSPDPHVCSTIEVAQSTYDAGVNDTLTGNTKAWILVDIRSALSQPSVDPGDYKPEILSCDGWKEAGATATGATVTATGAFGIDNCSNKYYVACCRLKSP